MIIDELKSKLVDFQKSGDTSRLDVLRFLLSLVKNKEIEFRGQHKEMTDEDVFKLIRKEIKNRKENIELYEKISRSDLLEKEKSELEIYLEFAKLFPFELESPNQYQNRNFNSK